MAVELSGRHKVPRLRASVRFALRRTPLGMTGIIGLRAAFLLATKRFWSYTKGNWQKRQRRLF